MIIAPLYITLGKKKRSLNLNTYRNLHYQVNNNLKIRFKEIIKPQIQEKYNKIGIQYILFYSRKSDLGNRVSVIDKYFLDALKELGAIEDDNIEYVLEMKAKVGGKDSKNPRMEIEIIAI